jgi:hypothetical protein
MFSVKKFREFAIFEANTDAESLIKQKLDQIESKIDKLFDVEEREYGEVRKFSQTEEEEDQPSEAFKRLQKETIERSQFSKTYKSLKLIFSDENFRYDLNFKINLEDVIKDGQVVESDTIEECDVEIKRYSLIEDLKPCGVIDKKIKIEDIGEKMFEELLTELETEYPSDEEADNWQIETE